MRWHVVGTLGIVPVNGITIWGRSLEPTFQILARGRIRVLLNQHAGRSVRDEDKTKAGLQTGLSYHRRDVTCNVVEPAALGEKLNDSWCCFTSRTALQTWSGYTS